MIGGTAIIDILLVEVIRDILSSKENPRNPGKCPLARNPDRSWWHRHTSLKIFCLRPMAPWTVRYRWYIYFFVCLFKICISLSRSLGVPSQLDVCFSWHYMHEAHIASLSDFYQKQILILFLSYLKMWRVLVSSEWFMLEMQAQAYVYFFSPHFSVMITGNLCKVYAFSFVCLKYAYYV